MISSRPPTPPHTARRGAAHGRLRPIYSRTVSATPAEKSRISRIWKSWQAGWLAGWQLDRGILRNWPGDAAGSDAVCTATTSKTLPAIPRSLTFQGSTSPPSSNFGPLPVFHYRLHFAISLVDDRRNTQPRLFEIALVETLRSSSGGFVTEI